MIEDNFKQYREHNRKILLRDLRIRLMEQHPFCYWCKQQVYEHPDTKRNLNKGERYPDNMATIDHLYSRFNPEKRYQVYKDHEDKVLACYACNTKRSEEEVKKLPKSYLKQIEKLAHERKAKKDTTPRPLYFLRRLKDESFDSIR